MIQQKNPSKELEHFAEMNKLTVPDLLTLSIFEIEQLSGLTAHLLAEIIRLQHQ